MSVHHVGFTVIACDSPTCYTKHAIPDSDPAFAFAGPVEFRAVVTRLGWECYRHWHFCPECRPTEPTRTAAEEAFRAVWKASEVPHANVD